MQGGVENPGSFIIILPQSIEQSLLGQFSNSKSSQQPRWISVPIGVIPELAENSKMAIWGSVQ